MATRFGCDAGAMRQSTEELRIEILPNKPLPEERNEDSIRHSPLFTFFFQNLRSAKLSEQRHALFSRYMAGQFAKYLIFENPPFLLAVADFCDEGQHAFAQERLFRMQDLTGAIVGDK